MPMIKLIFLNQRIYWKHMKLFWVMKGSGKLKRKIRKLLILLTNEC